MSIKEVTAYMVVCDEPDCGFDTSDLGGDFAFWQEKDVADDEWYESDGQRTAEGKHYCPKHTKPLCGDCDRAEGLVNDTDDASGDWWCPEHLETSPEYEAPGVVV